MTAERCRKTGKVAYPDKLSTVRAKSALAGRYGPSFRRLQAYQCQKCGLWHLGVPHRRAS
jgi:hypothetical protein